MGPDRTKSATFGETGQHIAPTVPLQHQIDAVPEIPIDHRPPFSPKVQQYRGDQVIPFHRNFPPSLPAGVYLKSGLLD